MSAGARPLRLTYSPGWAMISGFAAPATFLLSLVEVSVLHPMIFDRPLTAATLWAGLLMPVPLWFLTHLALLSVLRGLLWPFGIPGRVELDEDGVRLRLGRHAARLAWSEVRAVHTGPAPLDFDAVSTAHPGGAALAEAGARLAAKDWHVTVVGPEHRTIEISSQGFRRPMRRAEPRLRAWLAARLEEPLGPLSETQVVPGPAAQATNSATNMSTHTPPTKCQ